MKSYLNFGLVLAFVYSIINILLINDYGFTWDTFFHLNEAQSFWQYLKSFSSSGILPQAPYGIWPGLLSHFSFVIFNQKLPWLSYDASHFLPLILLGSLGIIIIYNFVYKAFGLLPALFSAIFLSLFPHYLLSLHTNIKDLPLAVIFAAAILSFYSATQRPSFKSWFLAAIVLGLALATKVNAFLLLPLFLIWLSFYHRRHFFPSRFLLFISVTLISTYIFWPYLWIDPIARLISAVNFFKTVDPTKQILYFGQLYSVSHHPWHYPFGFLSVITPIPVLFLSLIGLSLSLYRAIVRRQPQYGLILLWFFIPTLKYLNPSLEVFDNIRHFLEVVFPWIIFAGVGSSWLLSLASRQSQWIVKLGLILIILHLFLINHQLHPYQNAYFNQLVSGPQGAQVSFDLDYWGFSLKAGSGWLNQHAPRQSLIYTPLANQVARFYLRHDLQIAEKLSDANYFMVFAKPSNLSSEEKDYYLTHPPIYTISRSEAILLNIFQLDPPSPK